MMWCAGRCAFIIALEWCAERHRSEHPAQGRMKMKHPKKEERRAEMGENGKGEEREKLSELDGKRHRVRLQVVMKV